MIRYVARPRAFIDDIEQQMRINTPERLTGFEPNGSRDIGIVDVRGNPIYSVSETEAVGFVPVK